jgi:hypothetical protein
MLSLTLFVDTLSTFAAAVICIAVNISFFSA